MIEAGNQLLLRGRWGGIILDCEVDDPVFWVEDALLTPESLYKDVTDLLFAVEMPQLTLVTSVVELYLIFCNLLLFLDRIML